MRTRPSRFAVFVTIYLAVLALAYFLVVEDWQPHQQMINGRMMYVSNGPVIRSHMLVLGVLGFPFSLLALGYALYTTQNAGIPAGFIGGATLMAGLLGAPLLNLIVLGAMALRRGRSRRGGAG